MVEQNNFHLVVCNRFGWKIYDRQEIGRNNREHAKRDNDMVCDKWISPPHFRWQRIYKM